MHDALHGAFDPLAGIFKHYAMTGAANDSAAKTHTMQKTELTNLALDIGLATKLFPMVRLAGPTAAASPRPRPISPDLPQVRVGEIFERADLGDGGGRGDLGLELHEFLECIVMLSFHRANPRFGEHDEKHGPPMGPVQARRSSHSSSLDSALAQ